MRYFLYFISTLIVVTMMNSCSKPKEAPLKISATTWIGYIPLFYAQEKGWLDKSDIRLIHTVSLSENMYTYQAGKSDAYVGTQYEHSVLKKSIPTLMPILLFDRSNGGDIIMSNVSITALQNSSDTINTYLEMDSINRTLLEDFIRTYHIDEKRIKYINRDQKEISVLENDTTKKIVIITYIPFNLTLKEQGFKEILSTKNGLDLLVVDALYTRSETLAKHKKQFSALKSYVDQAVDALHENPKVFYDVVKHYLDGMQYTEFVDALNDIIWINKTFSKKLNHRLEKAQFPLRDLI